MTHADHPSIVAVALNIELLSVFRAGNKIAWRLF
jgi:hypothetical protein